MGRLRRASTAVVLVVAALALVGGPLATVTAAADEVTFGTPTVTGAFGQDITFRQPVTLGGTIERAELLVTFADALGPQVFVVAPPVARGSGQLTLEHTIQIADQGHILPNTPMVARWRLTPRDDPLTPAIGPEIR